MYIIQWWILLFLFINNAALFAAPSHKVLDITAKQKSIYNFIDSVPKTNDVTVIIPFEYKQSSLNYTSTFKLIDSVAEILLADTLITLSINGFSYFDEGSNNICYWLSLNRALAVKYYVLGRGVDSARLMSLKGLSSLRSKQRRVKHEPVEFNCTAEIILNYPIPPPPLPIADMDEDGIADAEDSCRNEYGDKAHNGCPNKNAIIVPFEPQESSLISQTYRVLDSVVNILRNNPELSISIEGHAYNKEGVNSVCEKLSMERADIVKRYLLTRRVGAARIESIKSFSNLRPINAGRNPWEIARNSRAEILLINH